MGNRVRRPDLFSNGRRKNQADYFLISKNRLRAQLCMPGVFDRINEAAAVKTSGKVSLASGTDCVASIDVLRAPFLNRPDRRDTNQQNGCPQWLVSHHLCHRCLPLPNPGLQPFLPAFSSRYQPHPHKTHETSSTTLIISARLMSGWVRFILLEETTSRPSASFRSC